jgi:hypothetical protein
MIRRIIIYFSMALMFSSCSSNPTLPPIAISMHDPSTNKYTTYTVFFSARKIELSESEIQKQNFLQKSFEDFAESIGSRNAAVWVGSTYKEFDIKVSKKICDTYRLSYTGGPYIIFSSQNPILSQKRNKDDVVLDFTSVNSDRIKFVLDELEQGIRLGDYEDIDTYEQKKQIVLSLYDNNVQFIHDAIIAILSRS